MEDGGQQNFSGILRGFGLPSRFKMSLRSIGRHGEPSLSSFLYSRLPLLYQRQKNASSQPAR